MTVGGFFYQLLISPLELLLEAIYGMAESLFGNQGLAIFLMSLVMNILLLPLYRQADAIQAEERDIEKQMEPWVKHIKKTFKGDERFMMLQTYYNQNHYKPYYTLKSSLPLALEVPFFIAAYHFLSNLRELNGSALGPIHNLGTPDGLLVIGSLAINILPILMTLINIISAAIYTKGFPFKDKITLYGMALIFLVLLYPSPSGLVFYWTLNNLFSLVKNVFYKIKNPKKVLLWLVSAAGGIALVYGCFFYRTDSIKHKILVMAIALFMELPLLVHFFFKRVSVPSGLSGKIGTPDYKRFLCSGLFLAVLTGVLIPSAVISSSPEEFVQLGDFYSPLRHILNAALSAGGAFLIWFGVFYYLLTHRARKIFESILWIVSGISIVDYMFFGTKMGELTPYLKFENDSLLASGNAFSMVSSTENLANLLSVAVVAGILLYLFFKRERIVKTVYTVLLLAVAILSIFNIIQIQKVVPDLRTKTQKTAETETAHFNLSKDGKNVVVIMLDRAIGSYIPYIFQEKPELEAQFAGFAYYPNTVSFGGHTIFAAPALFGGYEYTPAELNKRTEERLAAKHNEALKVMPVLFASEGYDVTVCDPPCAGYAWIPDLTIFDDYPEIHTFNTENGQFSDLSEEESLILVNSINEIWRHHFFCYSLMKISPLLVQPTMYQHGSFFLKSATAVSTSEQICADMSHAEGNNSVFRNSYSVLAALPEMTGITSTGNNALILQNSTAHEPTMLQEPAYEPALIVNNAEYDETHQDRFTVNGRCMAVSTKFHMNTYHVNMAALLKLGEWFDFLRENEVFDNTRIIIVSDHGNCLNQFEDQIIGKVYNKAGMYDDVMYYNPLLLVKDFNSTELVTDASFMTNADVPTIAMSNLFGTPVNPFTGKAINSDAKFSSDQLIIASDDWSVNVNNGTVFLPATWYSVHDNIFDLSNWQELGKW